MISIMQKLQENRSNSENELLCSLLQDIAFFKEREIQEQDFIEIVNSLQYQFYPQHQVVFNLGKCHSGVQFLFRAL